MKAFLSLVSLVLVTRSAVTEGWEMPEQPPVTCNPAVHCLPGAVECISADVSIEGKIPEGFDVNTQKPGFCTDTFRPKCKWQNGKCKIKNKNNRKRTSFDQSQERCAQLMVTTASALKKTAKAKDYVSACMAGYYTCFDGSCKETEQECRANCRRMKCDEPPVRYGPERCDYDCRGGEDALELCPASTGKNTTIKDHQIVLPFVPPTPEKNITEVHMCCNPGPYESIVPEFSVTFENYEGETCCTPVDDVDFGDISNDYLPSNEPGTYNIYPIRNAYPNGTADLVEVGITFTEPFMENDCCCNILCTCAGDPHCSAFDGTQAVSRRESGTLNMITEGDFSLYTSMGVDGVIDEVTFTLPGYPGCSYSLKSRHALKNKWLRSCNGGDKEVVPEGELPQALGLNINFDGDIYCVDDDSSKECAGNGGTLKIGTKLEVSLFVRRFIPLFTNQDPLYRFDVHVRRFTGGKVSTDDGLCCPGYETALPLLLEQLKAPASGFCYQPLSEEVSGFFENNGLIFSPKDTNRRLSGQRERLLPDDVSNLNKIPVCDKYMRVAMKIKGVDLDKGIELQQCVNEFVDYGEEGVLSLIDSLKASRCKCINYEDVNCGQTFRTPLTACQSGVTLEARNKGSNDEWHFVRAFPANKNYCNDLIKLYFTDGNQMDFDYNGVETLLDIASHDIRFIERTDTPSECNQCQPRERVENFELEFTYQEERTLNNAEPKEPVQCVSPSTGCRDCIFIP